MRGIRSGDKGRGKDGEPLGNFEPGADVTAQATVLAEGTWGHLTGAAIREFDLAAGREPQVWALGVKEVWKVPQASSTASSTRWAGRCATAPSTRSSAARGSTRWATTASRSASSSASTTPTPPSPATTCCSSSRRAKLVRGILEGGERVAWGAKAIPEGGYWAMPKLTAPGHGHRRRRGRHGQRARSSRASTTPSTPGSWPPSRSSRSSRRARPTSRATSRRSRTRSSARSSTSRAT